MKRISKKVLAVMTTIIVGVSVAGNIKVDKDINKVNAVNNVNQSNMNEDGVLIKAKYWLHDNQDENKDLKGNVIIEDNEKIIEISADTYNEIEHGENSNLDGDVYIPNSDIISRTNKLQHQVKSLNELKDNFSKFNIVDSKENNKYYTLKLNNNIVVKYEIDCDMFYVNGVEYESLKDAQKCVDKLLKQKYENSKNALISRYGEDTYKLMNQEEGIKNEQESYNHFIVYGI